MNPLVLHIHDTDEKIDTFMLLNMMHTRSDRVVLHVDREDGATEIVAIGPNGHEGEVMVAGRGQCGCP